MPARRTRAAGPDEASPSGPPSGIEALGPELASKIDSLPREPGVYCFRDRKGKALYVGKAADLRARVRSYFTRSGDTRPFIRTLGRSLGDVETIVTRSESEYSGSSARATAPIPPRCNRTSKTGTLNSLRI